MNTNTPAGEAEAIGIFFPVPSEEQMAVRTARLLSRLVPDYIAALRPETTLAEIFSWAESSSTDTVQFVESLERVLGFEFDEFIDDFDRTTFREVVEYAVRHQSHAA